VVGWGPFIGPSPLGEEGHNDHTAGVAWYPIGVGMLRLWGTVAKTWNQPQIRLRRQPQDVKRASYNMPVDRAPDRVPYKSAQPYTKRIQGQGKREEQARNYGPVRNMQGEVRRLTSDRPILPKDQPRLPEYYYATPTDADRRHLNERMSR
jgi:hypothetical protein